MATPRLLSLSAEAYYLKGAVNVGVISNQNNEALLLDSGGDQNYARLLRQAIERAGLRAVAILNTHSHADHYGGNDYLVRHLKLPVWAPEFEEVVLRYPYLEPMYLYGGAAPLKELRNKWLEAKPSPVDHLVEVKEGSLEIEGFQVMCHVSSGHAVRQIAIGIGKVCYAADAFFGQEVLEKYQIPFVHDVAGQLLSLEQLLEWPYEIFLPGHGEPTEDIAAAVRANKAAIEHTIDRVRVAVGGGATISEVVHRVTAQLKSPPSNLSTYFLMHSCVLAYLSYLSNQKEITPIVEKGALRWEVVTRH